MEASSKKFKTTDEYLLALPVNTKTILKEVRKAIKQAVPIKEPCEYEGSKGIIKIPIEQTNTF